MQTRVLVVRDEPGLLVTYLAEGTPFTFVPGPEVHPWADREAWQGHGVLQLQRPGELKDDELLDQRVREGRFTQDQARAIRAEAARVTAELDAGRRWWDDSWAEWRPPVA